MPDITGCEAAEALIAKVREVLDMDGAYNCAKNPTFAIAQIIAAMSSYDTKQAIAARGQAGRSRVRPPAFTGGQDG